jgi:hypothetical protein
MYKNATKCNETLSKWCKNKYGASKIIDTFETYHLTAPYSSQQNGIVERRNQTVVAMARSMMKSKGMPGRFWGETVSTAVYLLNKVPTKCVVGMN